MRVRTEDRVLTRDRDGQTQALQGLSIDILIKLCITMSTWIVGSTNLAFILWQLLKKKKTSSFPEDEFPLQNDALLELITQLCTTTPPLNFHTAYPPPSPPSPEFFASSVLWIDTPEALASAVSTYIQTPSHPISRVALDIEHHSMHSYNGITCLLQLAIEQTPSTPPTILLIDAIALSPHIAPILGPSLLSNPKILKVVHGGGNDVLWLLRDFSLLRLLNIFDTEKATLALGYQSHQRSLKYLLHKFVDIDVDKTLQKKGDWRQRPLPDSYLTYAVLDVYYLLYVADCLAQELETLSSTTSAVKSSTRGKYMLMQAIERSQSLSTAVESFSPVPTEVASSTAAVSILLPLFMDINTSNTRIVAWVVHVLCVWRDATARRLDEGLACILPDPTLVDIALKCCVTKEITGAEELRAFLSSHAASACGCFPSTLISACDVVFDEITQAMEGNRPWSHPDVRFWLDGSNEVVGSASAASASSASLRFDNINKSKRKKEDEVAFRQRLGERFGVKTVPYENCKMYARSGELLCFTDKKRLLWYIRKGLAEEVVLGADPLTVRLLFDHKDNDQRSGHHHFYSTARLNRCVSCGASSYFLRYRVVPSCYRRAMPERLKSHRSHDVLLLCIGCHEVAQRSAEEVKKEIARDFNIPLFCPTPSVALLLLEHSSSNGSGGHDNEGVVATTTQGKQVEPSNKLLHPMNIRKSTLALYKEYETKTNYLPEGRRCHLQHLVTVYARSYEPWLRHKTQADAFSNDELYAGLLAGMPKQTRRRQIRTFVERDGKERVPKALRMEIEGEGDEEGQAGTTSSMLLGHQWHGQKVVEKLLLSKSGDDEALNALCVRFRSAFVAALQPKYLPEGWAVDHIAPRAFGDHSSFHSDDDGGGG